MLEDGQEWLVGIVDAVVSNTVAGCIGALDSNLADIVVLIGQDESTFIIVETGGETDANERNQRSDR